jgi:hypothetical protein
MSALVDHRKLPRNRMTAGKFIGIDRVSPDDVVHRLIDRDAREQTDTRTAVQRWLGDPPPGRSALAQQAVKNKDVRFTPKSGHVRCS